MALGLRTYSHVFVHYFTAAEIWVEKMDNASWLLPEDQEIDCEWTGKIKRFDAHAVTWMTSRSPVISVYWPRPLSFISLSLSILNRG